MENVLITGAASGIGAATARLSSARSYSRHQGRLAEKGPICWRIWRLRRLSPLL